MGKYDSYVNAEGVRISKATGKPVKKYNKVNKATGQLVMAKQL